MSLKANMKTQLTLLSIVLMASLSQAQTETEIDKTSRWKVGVLFSPDINYYDRYENQTDGTRKKVPKSSFGNSTGLNIEYALSKRLSLLGGINYSYKLFKPDIPLYGVLHPETGEFFNGVLLTNRKLHSVEMPLYLKYSLLQDRRKVNPYLFLGANAGIKITEVNTYQFINGTGEMTLRFKEIGLYDLWPEFGFGLDYQVSERFSVGFQLTMRLNTNGMIYGTAPAVGRMGIGVVLRYRF